MRCCYGVAIILITLLACGVATAADSPQDELLARVRATASTLQTLRADADRTFTDANGKRFVWTGTLEVKRPNRLRLELREKGGAGRSVEIWDGHQKWQRSFPSPYYSRSDLAADTAAFFPGIGWPGYSAPGYEDLLGDAERTMHSIGKQTVDGMAYDVLEMTGLLQTVRWYVGPDNRIYRLEETTRQFSFSEPQTLVLSHIQEGIPIDDNDFIYDAAGAREQTRIEHPQLIPVGHTMPRLDLHLASGGTLRLADVCRGKKALLVFSINYPS